MTNEQRIDAIKELANGLTGEELYVLANELMPQHFATVGWFDSLVISAGPSPIISGGFSKAILDIEHSFPND